MACTFKHVLIRLFLIIQEMSADVYSSLLKGLTMPDTGDISCYPVRVSAAGAITELVEVCCPQQILSLCNLSEAVF